MEVDSNGDTIWEITGLKGPKDADKLVTGNILFCNTYNKEVKEVTTANVEIWSYSTGIIHPTDADRLANGNTLITDMLAGKVIEVSDTGVVWSKTGLRQPVKATRLSSGNTLIAEFGSNRVIEVDNSGTVKWYYNIGGAYDVIRVE